MDKKGFILPIGYLPKIIGAVIVIAVIAVLFLVSSSFVVNALSDSSATASFLEFTRKLSGACISGGEVFDEFEMHSQGFQKYYAIGLVNNKVLTDGLKTSISPKSYNKLETCVNKGACLCLFKISYSEDTLEESDDHPCPISTSFVISKPRTSALGGRTIGEIFNYGDGNGDGVMDSYAFDILDKWSASLANNIKTLSDDGVTVTILQCKPLEDMKCYYSSSEYEPFPLLPIKKDDYQIGMLLWVQAIHKTNGDATPRWVMRTNYSSIQMSLPLYQDRYFTLLTFNPSSDQLYNQLSLEYDPSTKTLSKDKVIYTTVNGGWC